MDDRTAKNTQIKMSLIATRAKRETQVCKVFTVKVQENHLNKVQRESLKMMFVEAKRIYNHVLNLSRDGQDVSELKYNDLTEIRSFDKDHNEVISKPHYLSSQMKQAVLDGILYSIKGLAASKRKGRKVGQLKFISDYDSINLKQAGVSYKILSDKRIKIQGLKKPLRVNGLKQITSLPEYELANAKLIHKASGYYIALTVYLPSDEGEKAVKPKIGIDMGCQTSVTLSDGRKMNPRVEESETVKRLQRQIDKTKKGSSNRWKLRLKLRRAMEKDANRRNDIANKTAAMLKEYTVVMQDEQLANWKKSGHGKAVHHSILGRLKASLSRRKDTVVLSKWLPTTKLCTECGSKADITLDERTFVCPCCGHTEDRDIHAAKNMIWFSEHEYEVTRADKQDKTCAEHTDDPVNTGSR